MKKLFLYILSFFILTGCSDEIPEHEPPLQARRAILAYLIANNNLDTLIDPNTQKEGGIQANLKWMYEGLATSKDSCTLIVYYKPNASKNDYIKEPEILLFATDGNGNINGMPALQGNDITLSNIVNVAHIYEAIPGIATDIDVMSANLQMMKNIIPAESYGIIFASHATSWMPALNTSISTFSFGQDGAQRNSINIPEFADVIETCFPGNLDFILFDACMMQTAEVCYELRKATHYCIASVMETPYAGYPYHRILTNLYKDDINFEQLCNDIIDFNKELNQWGTYAVVDCTQMDAFAAAIREEITSKASLLENLSLHAIQQYGVDQFSYFSFDVADLIRQLNEGILPDSFQQILNQTVLTKSCITNSNANPYGSVLRDEEKYCGIGMYIPDAVDNTRWNAYYRSAISWYQAVWGN